MAEKNVTQAMNSLREAATKQQIQTAARQFLEIAVDRLIHNLGLESEGEHAVDESIMIAAYQAVQCKVHQIPMFGEAGQTLEADDHVKTALKKLVDHLENLIRAKVGTDCNGTLVSVDDAVKKRVEECIEELQLELHVEKDTAHKKMKEALVRRVNEQLSLDPKSPKDHHRHGFTLFGHTTHKKTARLQEERPAVPDLKTVAADLAQAILSESTTQNRKAEEALDEIVSEQRKGMRMIQADVVQVVIDRIIQVIIDQLEQSTDGLVELKSAQLVTREIARRLDPQQRQEDGVQLNKQHEIFKKVTNRLVENVGPPGVVRKKKAESPSERTGSEVVRNKEQFDPIPIQALADQLVHDVASEHDHILNTMADKIASISYQGKRSVYMNTQTK